MKRIYEVLAEGWLEDAYRMPGDTVSMLPVQAEYLLKSGHIAEKAEPKPTPAKPASK